MAEPSNISHYRITGKLGEGGMGAVYRATDTKLNRDVAIKVLPDSFAADADRMARFQREAQVLASLNHPNIAGIYGVEDRALVLELVDGPTLDERIAKGALPWAEALPLIGQLIDAIETAHEKGVVHRDLKPANIKITLEGRLKVLDFGLAKALSSEPAASGDPRMSPTLTMQGTMAGAIMGTAAYMAPEQARGQVVDKRADIWAFGVVVYEMLTGRQPFLSHTVSDTLASVITREPDFQGVPAQGERLLRACLEKDAKRRLRDIGDARRMLEEAAVPAAAPIAARANSRLWMVAAALLAVIAAGTGWIAWRNSRPVDRPLVRLSVDLGPEAVSGSRVTAAMSPDGTRLVFNIRNAEGKLQLASRMLDQPKATPLAGTEGAADAFFSSDGEWIGFFSGSKLKKVSVHGGATVTLCEANGARGAAWGDDGFIILAPALTTGLQRVPVDGGAPEPITEPMKSGEVTHRWPQILPGGKSILFTASKQAGDYDASTLKILSRETGQIKQVLSGGYFGRYLPGGYLIYIHQGTLFAVRFDLDRMETRGTAVPVQDEVAANPISGAGQFDFTQDGTLVYLGGKGQAQGSVNWVDSAGKAKQWLPAARLYLSPRFSPDGQRVAVGVGSGDLWVYDRPHESMTQLTYNARVARAPVWTPDGKHLALTAIGSQGGYDIWYIRADGVGEPQVLVDGKGNTLYPFSFSHDGKRLAYMDQSSQGSFGISVLPVDMSDPDHPKPGKPEAVPHGPASESDPAFSPDGLWLAYTSNESGAAEVYVRPYHESGKADSGGRWRISTSGGKSPQWSRDGRKIFFLGSDDRIAVADCAAAGQSFNCGRPRTWSNRQIVDTIQGPLRMFDVAPDLDGFAYVEFNPSGGEQRGSLHVNFLLNFFDELRRRVPSR